MDCKFFQLIEFKTLLFSYQLALDSDSGQFGGHNRLDPKQTYQTYPEGYAGRANHIPVYIPSRTVIVLAKKAD
jgi:1,4-alpha-glucan branching enzyme